MSDREDAEDLGLDRPHSARMYDYYLGGTANYEVDRRAAEEVTARFPTIAVAARVNRAWMQRSTRYVAGQGVTRFLDIGTGIPTSPNLHEIAQSVVPQAQVVYVDNDPLVLDWADALLESSPEGRTQYVHADVNDPAGLLRQEPVRELLAGGEPVCLSLNALLHFIGDKIAPGELVRALVRELPAGSFLALSHCTPDFAPQEWNAVIDVYRSQGTYAEVRTYAEVAALFAGLDLVEPGVVVGHRWRPEPASGPSLVENAQVSLYVGLGRKP